MSVVLLVMLASVGHAQDLDEDGCVDSYHDANGACVAPTASIGPGVAVRSSVYIGHRVTLVGRVNDPGNLNVDVGTTIGRGTYIGADQNIGVDNTIARSVDIGQRFTTEANATVGYASSLGDDVFVGNGAIVGSLAQIGDHTRLEANTVIARGTSIADSASTASVAGIIGPDVTIGSGFNMAAGTRIRKRATLGNDVSISTGGRVGRGATIGDGVTIGANARVSADAEVTAHTTVPDGVVVARGEVYDDPQITVHQSVSFNPTTVSGGCSYNNTHAIQYENVGSMDWRSCMVAASERGAAMGSNVNTTSGSGEAGWTPHRVGTYASYAGRYYADDHASTSTSRACVLSKDQRAPSVVTGLTDTVVHQGETWRYEDVGSQHYDECTLLAAEAGASVITPQTIGLSGNGYWVTSQHTCNVYQWVASSNLAMSYDTASAFERAPARPCMIGYIESVAP